MGKPYAISVYFNGEYLNMIPYSRLALKELRRKYVATEKKKRAPYKQRGLLFSRNMELEFNIVRARD